MFYNATTGENELDITDRMKKYVGVEVKTQDDKIGKIIDAYSCYDGEFFKVYFSEIGSIDIKDSSPIIQESLEKVLINFKNYSCVLITHSENYNKPISDTTEKDDVFIYDSKLNLITTVSKLTKSNDWFAPNVYKKENEDTLLIDTFYGIKFKIDMNNLEVIEKTILK